MSLIYLDNIKNDMKYQNIRFKNDIILYIRNINDMKIYLR